MERNDGNSSIWIQDFKTLSHSLFQPLYLVVHSDAESLESLSGWMNLAMMIKLWCGGFYNFYQFKGRFNRFNLSPLHNRLGNLPSELLFAITFKNRLNIFSIPSIHNFSCSEVLLC